MPIVLYKWPGHAGLPSLTPACLQAEAYLRFSGAEFCVQEVSSASSTPTGVIPALDTGAEVPAATCPGDLAAAAAIMAALGRPGGAAPLDGALSGPQRAELLAFASLLAARLDPATQYTTWLEKRGFRELRKAAFGSSLPFPLSYIVPWSARQEMGRHLGRLDGTQAYAGACEALAALADRLAAGPGPFFFGNAPCSLDALLWGHLAFYRYSPVAAPVLRQQVESRPVLCRYVDAILASAFSSDAPPPPAAADEPGGAGWSDAAQGRGSAPKPPPSVEEVRMWRGSQAWLAGAAAAVGAYVVLGGHYFTISAVEDDGELDDDDDDDVEVEAAD